MAPGDGTPRRRWSRLALRALLVLLGIVALVISLAAIGLSVPAVRLRVLESVSEAVRSRTGLSIGADDLRLRLGGGQIEIRGARVAAEDQDAPFLTADLLRVTLDWRSLWSDRVRITAVRVEQPFLDLAALPQPGPSSSSSTDAGKSLRLDVLELDLVGGSIRGGAVPPSWTLLADRWRLQDLMLRGSFVADRLQLSEVAGRLIVDSRHRAPIEARLSLTGQARTDGSFEVARFAARGAGLELTGRAGGRLGSARPIDAALELKVDAARLFPDMTSEGRLAASGSLAIDQLQEPRLSAELDVRADGFPAQLLVLLERAALVDLDLAGTAIDVDAKLGVDLALSRTAGEIVDRIAGHADLIWRRDRQPLLTATVRSLTDPAGGSPSVHLAFEGSMLPDLPGQRKLWGELIAPDWLAISKGQLRRSGLTVDELDLNMLATQVGFDPFRGWRPAGRVTASIRADGPILAPTLSADFTWRHGIKRFTSFSARTLEPGNRAEPSLRLEFEGTVLPESAGRLETSGLLEAHDWGHLAQGRLVRSRLDLDLPDLPAVAGDLSGLLRELLPDDREPAWMAQIARGNAAIKGMVSGGLSGWLSAQGPLTELQVESNLVWRPSPNETVRLAVAGRPTLDHPTFIRQGRAELRIDGFRISRIAAVDGQLSGQVVLEGSPSDYRAELTLEAERVRLEEHLGLDDLRLDAIKDGAFLVVTGLSGQPVLPDLSPGPFMISGRAGWSLPIRQAEARFEIEQPIAGVDQLLAAVRLADGMVHIDSLEVESFYRTAMLAGTVPVAALTPFIGPLDSLPLESCSGPIELAFSNLELGSLAYLLGLYPEPAPFRAVIDGSFSLDSANLPLSKGQLQISELAWLGADKEITAPENLDITLGGARIELHSAQLHPVGELLLGAAPVECRGVVELAPEWEPGKPLTELVRTLSFDVRGAFEAAVFQPLLYGARASGVVEVDAHAEGPLDGWTAEITIDGPQARLYVQRPYATKIESPQLTLKVRDGRVVLEQGRARLNGGNASFSGSLDRERGLELETEFDSVRYRLDFGLTTQAGGRIQVSWPPEGRRRINGKLLLDRGVLRRDVDLDRAALRALFEPDAGTGSATLFDTVELDIDIETVEGVDVKNNLAELHADWARLSVGGTLAHPTLAGRIDVDPGGWLLLLGQVIRIDEASFNWSGQPPWDPRVELETTSSLEDPTIRDQYRKSAWSSGLGDRGPGQGGTLDFRGSNVSSEQFAESVTTGVATYYRDRLTGAVAGGLDRTELSFEPLPLFGETNIQARFTLTQELSNNLTFIASTDPRDPEAQSYILNVHQLAILPSFRLQLFSNDEKNAGATLQQTLQLGGRPRTDSGPRVRQRNILAPEGVSTRRIRRAIGYRKGDVFPHGAALDVEVDVAEALGRRGYPSTEVEVTMLPVPETEKPRVDLGIKVIPGPRTRVYFEGDKPVRAARRDITSLYRAQPFEAASFERMQEQTIRALHGRGYPTPEVELYTEPEDPDDPSGRRVVRIRGEGGKKIDPQPRFSGLIQQEAAALAAVFTSRQSRVELAVGSPAADVQLLRALREFGYPEARIAGRELSPDGDDLTVDLVPGPQERFVGITILGVDPSEQQRLAAVIELQQGAAAHRDRIVAAARTIEADLKARGHADARVQTRLEQVSPERPYELTLSLDVDPGPVYRVEEVHFEGLRSTRRSWVEKIAGLPPGDVYQADAISGARRRLYQTGVFRRILVSTERPAQTDSDAEHPTTIRFDLEEAPRYWLSYGARWESTRGLGLVVDLVDRNSLNIGHTSGVRLIYGSDLKSLRLYHVIPRVTGPKSTLELFLEGGQELIAGQDVGGAEAWAQLTWPVGRRSQTRIYGVIETRDIDPDRSDPDLPLDDRVISPRLGWQFAYTTIDNAFAVERRKGVFWGIDLSGSLEELGSDLTALGAFTQIKYYLPFANKLTWGQSYRFGLLDAAGQPIPFPDRLRLGGEFSVRGYPTNSLGPLSPDGVPLGGELQFVMNQELSRFFGHGVSALIFLDAGNVWATQDNADVDLFRSVGVGARYASPIGPLRLDVGFPLDKRTIDSNYEIYIGFGGVF